MRKTLRHRIADTIMRDYINVGQTAIGDALPSTRDMQKQYGVSSGTILSAIAILEAQGLVTSRHGSGCYIAGIPNHQEQPTQKKDNRWIGLVCNSPSADINKRIHRGVDLMCNQYDYHVLVASTDFRYSEEEAQVDRLVRSGCRGIVLYPVVRTEEQAKSDYLNRKYPDYPILMLDLGLSSHNRSQVLFDNYRAGYDMTEYLLKRGHKRIAFMDYQCGDTKFLHRSIRERYIGYQAAMQSVAKEPEQNDLWMLEGEIHQDITAGIAHILLHWVEQVKRPTAVIALEDNSAARTISIARELGIRVPDELEIVGFDNLPVGCIIRPHITTTSPDFQRAGEIAVEMLMKHINGESDRVITYMLPAPVKPREASSLEVVAASIAKRSAARILG